MNISLVLGIMVMTDLVSSPDRFFGGWWKRVWCNSNNCFVLKGCKQASNKVKLMLLCFPTQIHAKTEKGGLSTRLTLYMMKN